MAFDNPGNKHHKYKPRTCVSSQHFEAAVNLARKVSIFLDKLGIEFPAMECYTEKNIPG